MRPLLVLHRPDQTPVQPRPKVQQSPFPVAMRRISLNVSKIDQFCISGAATMKDGGLPLGIGAAFSMLRLFPETGFTGPREKMRAAFTRPAPTRVHGNESNSGNLA